MAGAFWTPSVPVYDPALPAHPTYSDQEKQAQRDAADIQTTQMMAALAAGHNSYIFPPGVYRLRSKLSFWLATNFTLNLANVELITEDSSYISIINSTDITIRGPLALDADPCGVSQSVIVDSNNNIDSNTTMTVQLMPDYPEPTTKGRVMLFDSKGKRLPGGQATPESVKSLGNGCYALEFRQVDMDLGLRAAAQPGNFIVHEPFLGGMELRENRGVTFEQVTAYAGGGVWGIGEHGEDKFVQWRSLRRPGTNRLFAGGNSFQIEYDGGSFAMDSCEVAYNWDDLTDVYGAMGWSASNGQTDDTIWASSGNWQPGQDLVIYNGDTLELEGAAKIVSLDEHAQSEETSLQTLNEAFEAAGMRPTTNDASMKLIKLDQPIHISNLSIVECLQFRPERISIVNSYIHDGLNAGINAKGSNEAVIANNWVQRTTSTGIVAGEDYWWWEGPVPGELPRLAIQPAARLPAST